VVVRGPSFCPAGAEFFFKAISRAYECAGLLVPTNLPFGQ